MSKCEQCRWKLIDEIELCSYYPKEKEKLFQCEKCGRLLKIRLG